MSNKAFYIVNIIAISLLAVAAVLYQREDRRQQRNLQSLHNDMVDSTVHSAYLQGAMDTADLYHRMQISAVLTTNLVEIQNQNYTQFLDRAAVAIQLIKK